MNGFSNYYEVRVTQRLTCIINRNIWYDDIYGNFAVDVDYLYDGDTPGIPLADFKAFFRSHETEFDDDGECYICWNYGLYKESFTHDHFDDVPASYGQKKTGDLI